MTQVIDAVVVDGPRITSVAYVQGLPGPPGPPGPPGSGGGGGGTLTGLTPHALLLGKSDGTVNQLGAATNGQFLIGQTGADPAWAALSGDATVDRTGVVTLAASGVTAGQYGDGSHVAQITFDAKGRTTAAAAVPVAIDGSQVTGGTIPIGRLPTGTGTNQLPTGGVITAGSVGSAAAVPVLTFNPAGQITSASTAALGTSAVLNIDTDTTLAANSDTRIASQHAVKTYVDNSVTGLLSFKGSIDASTNPNYPAALKGDAYVVNVAGKVGGASGIPVAIGDMIVATANNAGGDQATVGTSWTLLQHLLVGALLATNNLSDLSNAATARTNLNLGNTATFNSGTGTNQIVLGGVITAGGPVGDAATVPQITWNPAGQIIAVTPVTIASDGIDTAAIHNGDSVGGTDIGGTYPGGLTINPGAVTLDDMADLPGNTMLGNSTSGLATPAAMSADDVLAFLGLGPISSPVPIVDGGTGAATQQAALDALAGAVTNNRVLAANGTHVTLRALTTADLPTGTSSSAVVVGGVITGAGPQGDPAHTQVLTFNNAGQLTTVTNMAIAIANTAVSGLGTASTHASGDFALLAGLSGGQTLIGGTAASDNLTFKPSSNGAPTGDVIILGGGAAGTTQIARFMNNTGLSKLYVGTGTPPFAAFSGIELNGGGGGSIYVENAPFGAGYIGTEAGGQKCMVDLRSSQGTIASPTHSLANDQLFGIQGGGGLDGNLRDCAQIICVAEQDFGPSQSGTRWEFWVTKNGTTPKYVGATIKNDGSLVLGGTASTITGATNMFDLSQASSSTVNVTAAPFGLFGVRNYAAMPGLKLERVNGTTGSPTALGSGHDIAQVTAFGSFDTSGSTQQGPTVKMTTTQAWTSTNNGSKITFATVANNSTTQSTALTLGQDQSATFANNITMSGTVTGATNMIDLSTAPSSTQNVVTAGFGIFGVRNYAAAPGLALQRVNGSAGSPAALGSGADMAQIAGYGSFDTSNAANQGPTIKITTTEAWNSTSNGGKITFSTIPNTTKSLTVALTLDQDQSATFAGKVTTVGNIGFNGKAAQAFTGIAAPTATALRTAAPNATYSTTGATGATVGAFDTQAHRDNVITDLANTMQRLGALITDLRANGVIG